MLKAAERSWDRPWKVHATRFRSFGASDEACLPASQITRPSTQVLPMAAAPERLPAMNMHIAAQSQFIEIDVVKTYVRRKAAQAVQVPTGLQQRWCQGPGHDPSRPRYAMRSDQSIH
jgi:hypothetical protein